MSVRDLHIWRPGCLPPPWAQRAGAKLLWWRPSQSHTAFLRTASLLWPQGEPILSYWYPFPAPLLQLLNCLSSLCSFGVPLVHSKVAVLMLQQTTGDTGQRGKARQSTWLAFSSLCLLKFALYLIFSARWHEIISVVFSAAVLLSQSFFLSFFFFASGAPSHSPHFSSCDTLNGEKLSCCKAEKWELVVITVNIHWPVVEKLGCCQYLKLFSSSLVRVITWEK